MKGISARILCMTTAVLGLAALPLTAVHAQALEQRFKLREFTYEEIAAVPMPDLEYSERQARTRDFKKYYYFHREDTSFAQAFADIAECDALASGLKIYAGGREPYPGYYANQYGPGGVNYNKGRVIDPTGVAIGAAIGSALGPGLADAINGSAARRATRRVNMRNCMGFKGYQRFGLPKNLWKEFNFEEGKGREDDAVREAALLQQAKVASGPRPMTQVLER